MSYRFHLMAARVPQEEMMEALERVVARLGSMPKKGQKHSRVSYQIHERSGWTVCSQGELGIIPALEVDLSRNLEADLVGFDTYEVVGYKHLSILHRGEVKALYTCIDAELDNEGIDWQEEANKALGTGVIKTSLKLLPGEDIERMKYDAEYLLTNRYGVNVDDLFFPAEGRGEEVSILVPSYYLAMGESATQSWRDVLNASKE